MTDGRKCTDSRFTGFSAAIGIHWKQILPSALTLLRRWRGDADRYVNKGFHILKIKVGIGDISDDVARIQAIRSRVGGNVKLRLDANQGWTSKEAVTAIRKMEDAGLGIELVERPVHKDDIAGLKQVTDAVDTPIMADESVFTPRQAFHVVADEKRRFN